MLCTESVNPLSTAKVKQITLPDGPLYPNSPYNILSKCTDQVEWRKIIFGFKFTKWQKLAKLLIAYGFHRINTIPYVFYKMFWDDLSRVNTHTKTHCLVYHVSCCFV